MKYILPIILLLSSCASNKNVPSTNKINLENMTNAQACSETIPMIMISPAGIYEEKYIENYFLFKFDIATSGKVMNLKLINSDSDEHMKKQARRAMAKWLFKPLVVNNKAIAQKGCEFRYTQKEVDLLSE